MKDLNHSSDYILTKLIMLVLIVFLIIQYSCKKSPSDQIVTSNDLQSTAPIPEVLQILNDTIKVGEYFEWLQVTLDDINSKRSDSINEYDLIHANPWILENLTKTDYYYLLSQDSLIDDILDLNVIHPGDKLHIPNEDHVAQIRQSLDHTYLDLNIPEFKLRIIQHDSVLYSMDVRVGKNDTSFLAMVGRTIDLRTMPGAGKIVRVIKDPNFINPKDNRKYKVTKRDDGRITTLPNIPWLEPEINGWRHGQLIHPTTNIRTLGKAASNGCIGLSEADAWRVYYYAPVGTPVFFRYNLEVETPRGIRKLKDIYPEKSSSYIEISNQIKNQNICHCE